MTAIDKTTEETSLITKTKTKVVSLQNGGNTNGAAKYRNNNNSNPNNDINNHHQNNSSYNNGNYHSNGGHNNLLGVAASEHRQEQRKQHHTMNIAEPSYNKHFDKHGIKTTNKHNINNINSSNSSNGNNDNINIANGGSNNTTTKHLQTNSNGHCLDSNSNSKQEETKKDDFKFSNLPKRKKIVLALCTTAMALVCCAFSLLGPFFPIEAEKKGMSIFLSGIVFGVFELVIFVTAPFYGNYLTTLGPKFVYIAGICVGGMCNILFGTLDKCPNGMPFIVMALLCRSVEGIGFSGFITASFAIVASEFPNHIGLTFGILETGSGVGFMIGPLVGGALYELGGYGLPFYAAGVLILLNAILVYKFLPKIETVQTKRKGSMLSLLKSPMVVIPVLCMYCGVLGITAFDATMAKHLEPFNLSTGLTGVMFGVVALVYSIMSPIWGYLTDTKDIQAPLIVSGLFFFGIAFLLNGPTFLIPALPYKLWVICIGLAIMGMSFGLTLVPTMKCMVKGAIDLGFENTIDTYSLVSGLFNSIHTLAGFAGPVGIGAIVEKYGYSVAYTVIALVSFFMMIVSGIFFGIRRLRRSGYYNLRLGKGYETIFDSVNLDLDQEADQEIEKASGRFTNDNDTVGGVSEREELGKSVNLMDYRLPVARTLSLSQDVY